MKTDFAAASTLHGNYQRFARMKLDPYSVSVSILAVSALISGCNTTSPSAPRDSEEPWVLVTDAAGGFSVLMPSSPQKFTEPSDGIPVHHFVANPNPSTELAVLYNDFPESIGTIQAFGTDSFFEALQKAALKTLGEGHLTYAANSQFASHPMRDLQFEVPAKSLTCKMRIILVDHRMYQLIVVWISHGSESAEPDTFFKSFRLLYD